MNTETAGAFTRGGDPIIASASFGDITQTARQEVPREDFSMSLEQLQVAVGKSCADGGPWTDRFAGGIRAALAFAVANPTAARALIDSRVADPESRRDHRELIEQFSTQFRECVPPSDRLSPSSEKALVGSIAGVVSGYLHSGDTDRLDEVAPMLVYLRVAPVRGIRRGEAPLGPLSYPVRKHSRFSR